ncbi:hypothetical protein [Ralstonia insidiosa]|uniref:hypothetical protein n=1 Tax=Ralstonia insidiosa TaxID=190721 RepID=UPI001427C230|nr:hypothetical protein [Ralstonia insidiosa]
MTPHETKWEQGRIVVYYGPEVGEYPPCGPFKPKVDSLHKIVYATDYVLLDMMGKIKHRTDGLPALRKGWPFSR